MYWQYSEFATASLKRKAILRDHLECGKHSPAEARAKIPVRFVRGRIAAGALRCWIFPPTTPPVSAQVALHGLLLPMKDASLDEVLK